MLAKAAADPAAAFEEPTLDFLAVLRARDPAAYERTVARLKQSKVRIGPLEKEVERRRPEPEANLQGRRLSWPEIEPWPDAVNGQALADALLAHLQRFAIIPSVHAAAAVALWVLHTHAFDAATHTPRLLISSPTHECGKGQVITWLIAVVPRPFDVIDPTGPTLFRPIEAHCPTVLIDEGDQVSWDDRKDLLAVIHSGHCRFSPGVPRCVGDFNEVVQFRVWAPLALAMIGKPKAIMLSRSIVIAMVRMAPDQTVEHRRLDRDQGFEELRRKCARWAADHLDTLREADPELPVTGRRADCWRPMVAIADAIGGDWPEQIRKAARKLSGIDTEDQALGVQLLRDVHTVFEEKIGGSSVSTELLLGHLHLLPERPWNEYGRRGLPLTAIQLADLLRPFGVRPQQLKHHGAKERGYRRRQFEEAWRRYL